VDKHSRRPFRNDEVPKPNGHCRNSHTIIANSSRKDSAKISFALARSLENLLSYIYPGERTPGHGVGYDIHVYGSHLNRIVSKTTQMPQEWWSTYHRFSAWSIITSMTRHRRMSFQYYTKRKQHAMNKLSQEKKWVLLNLWTPKARKSMVTAILMTVNIPLANKAIFWPVNPICLKTVGT